MLRFAIYDDEDVEAFKSKINILNEYCESQTIALVLQNLSSSALDNLLSKFYLCVRNKKGECYKINSMRSIRFSLQRYFLDFAKIDILGHDFADANTVFENTLRLVKHNWKGRNKSPPRN